MKTSRGEQHINTQWNEDTNEGWFLSVGWSVLEKMKKLVILCQSLILRDLFHKYIYEN